MRNVLRTLRTAAAWLLVFVLIFAGGLMVSPFAVPDLLAVPPEPAAMVAPVHLSAGGMSVHFIDMGDADSTLFLVDGRAMLVDGGNIGTGQKIIDYLDRLGVKELDVVVGTHPHADHMGGLSEVVSEVKFDKVYSCFEQATLGVFKHFQRIVERKGGKIEKPAPGSTFQLGSATVTVLGPQRDYPALNNMSMAIHVRYGDISFAVEGDAQREAEADIISAGLAVPTTVLRVGHHGSNDATSPEYLDHLKPKYAVIPCGENQNGHPHRRMLALLEARDIKVFRTDLDGTIVAQTDGRHISFTTEK